MPRLDAGSCEISRSPIRMDPLVTVSSPAIIRSVVVLPHPDGPSSATSSPGSIARSMPLTAVTLSLPRDA